MNYTTLIQTGLLQSENISALSEKIFIVEDVYSILFNAYKNVEGGLHFKDKDELLLKTNLWKIIYLDAEIVGVLIYKAKKGLKMVAIGLSSFLSKDLQHSVKKMLASIFQLTFASTWMEISEGVERFVLKYVGKNFFIKNEQAQLLTGKEIVSLDDDSYHYYRIINGILKRKIMIGTANFYNKGDLPCK